MRIRHHGGKIIQANNRELNKRYGNRDAQKWIAVLNSLEEKGMVELDREDYSVSYNKVTHTGYTAVDRIKQRMGAP